MLCRESNPRLLDQKQGFFAENVPLGIEPAPSFLRTDSSQLRYETLVTTQLALRLGSVRTISLRRLIYFGFGPFTREKHVSILTISMQTWRFFLKRVWSAGAPCISVPVRTPQTPQIFGKGIFAVLLYNLQSNYYCLIAPPP